MAKAKCGACKLCCTAMGVPELNKPNGVPCVHLTPEGCGIYEDRPPSCRVFECAYLQGMGSGLHTRPDYTGGVVGLEPDISGDGLGEALVIYGVEGKDPLRSKYLRDLIERVQAANKTAIVVVGQEDRKVFTTSQSHYTKRMAELMAEREDE